MATSKRWLRLAVLIALVWPTAFAVAVGPRCDMADQLCCATGADELTGPYNMLGAAPFTLEGATANAFETTVAVTDPTADRTFTIPDANSTPVRPTACPAFQFVNSLGSDGTVNCSSITDVTCSGACINEQEIDVLNGLTPLVFEGSSADASETTLTITNPTADRTFTLPDANSAGVQAITCASEQPITAISALGLPTCTNIYGSTHTWAAKQTMTAAPQIDVAAAAVGRVWTATDADGNGDWQSFTGAGGGGFTDGGTTVALTTISDKLGIGTAAATAKTEIIGDQPASVGVGNGTDADIGVNMVGGKGGNTTDVTGDVGGTGGGVFFQGGAGGDAPAGSTNGTGGSISFTAGLPGAGLGTAGNQGSVSMTGRLVTLDGAISLFPQTQTITADNTTLTVIRGGLTLTSDNITASIRTMIMPTPVTDGQLVVLTWTGTNGGELFDNGAQTGGGTTRLASTWTPTQYDTLTLFAPTQGGDWYELARSAN